MKHVIIGTAGHVDHGKTCLIKALTGIETDRLKEEKKRGITIELGFAWLNLPEGGKAGIVDVPGHERFVRNMLAGAGGIDLALLIVAADEGVMPQTREHLEILQLLELKRGIIVVTKADMVDEDWLELAKEDIREAVKGTFLEQAPIFAVSSHTGQGIDELRQEIFRQISEMDGKDDTLPYRQPIDRVFTMEGFGTVITGTVVEGSVKVGDIVSLYPEDIEVRVRSIQVHGEDVEAAFAGQRAAINIAQLARDELLRGDVLAEKHSMDISKVLDVRIQMLPDAAFEIKNRSRVHFHHGSTEKICRVRLLDCDSLKAGETGYARLLFDEDLAAKYGDHFILRFFSPLETIGGGVILDPCPPNVKIKDAEWRERLSRIEDMSPAERLACAVDCQSPYFMSLDFAVRRSGLGAMPEAQRSKAVEEAFSRKLIVPLNEHISLSEGFIEKMALRAQTIIRDFHAKEPLKAGLKREELRTRLLPDNKIDLTDKLITLLEEKKVLVSAQGLISLPEFRVSLTPEQEKISAALEKIYEESGFTPPDTAEVLGRFPKKQRPEAVLSDLIDRGVIKRLDANISMHSRYIEEARQFVIDTIHQNGSIKLAEFRDHIGSSRKFAVAILDAFDREKLTRMQGDARILL